MFNFKKLATAFLLSVLTIATCFVFTGCNKNSNCRNGYMHHFDTTNHCMYCDKAYCEVYGHSFSENDFCGICGATETKNGCKSQPKDNDIPVGGVLGFNIGLLIVGIIAHYIGISILSPFLMRAPIVVYFFTTIAVFFQFGILCGIITLIFLIIYTLITVGMNKKFLGYDDIF